MTSSKNQKIDDSNLMGDLSSCEYLRRWWISRGFVASENRVKIDDVIKKSENRSGAFAHAYEYRK